MLSLFFSCKKDKPDVNNATYKQLPGKKMIVCNEGTLGSGNASLSIYNIDFDTMQNDVYKAVNLTTMGDVLQSSLVYNDALYLAVNNSNKVLVADKNSLQNIADISIPNPRNMIISDENELWVSSLYNHYIYQINTTTKQLEDSIYLPYKNTEGLLYHNQLLYVAVWDTACSQVYVVNTNTHNLIDSIALSVNAPHSLLMDKNNDLWVFSGNVYYGVKNAITKIDIATQSIIQQFEYSDLNSEMIKPAMNTAKDSLYWLGVNYSGTENNGVFKMSITSGVQPEMPFIKASPLQYFWGLFIYQDKIFVSDPKGFIQKGDLLIYNLSGELEKTIPSGLGIGNLEMVE